MPMLNGSLEPRPSLDIASYARRGPGRRDRLSPAEVSHISRTVRRAPEAVIKVLTSGSSSLAGVANHLDYVGRNGKLDLETDDGDLMSEKELGRQLVENWDLDLEEHRRGSDLTSANRRSPAKLVHKLILSMPPGTPAPAVLNAARSFLREQFALKHRYSFVLHTDEPHPHVHAVVKAVSEQGVRLNIKKATLREWRSEFARHLRAEGVEANATERAVRGMNKSRKPDGIYRAEKRGVSAQTFERVTSVAAEISSGALQKERNRVNIVNTRKEVTAGWHAAADLLAADSQLPLAERVRQFAASMPPPRTDRELVATELIKLHRQHRREPREIDARTR